LPADRWSSALDFANALEGRGGAARNSAPAMARRRTRASAWSLASPLPWAIAFGVASAAAVLAAAWGWRRLPAAAQQPGVRFTLQTAAGSGLAFPYFGAATTVAISPDGRMVVYSATGGASGNQLYLQSLGELRPRLLPGTEGARFPEFSPDGRWLAYVSNDQKLRKTPVEGGASTTLCDVGYPNGLTWLSNGSIVSGKLAVSAAHGLWRVPATGGEPQRFSSVDSARGERVQWFPRSANAGQLVFYTSGTAGVADTHIGVARAETGESTQLTNLLGSFALGLVNGYLLYVRNDGTLMAAPFDTRSLRAGPPIPIADSVAVALNVAAAALSASGSLAYVRGGGVTEVVTVDERGEARLLLDERRAYAHPRMSPDGRKIAFDVASSQGSDIWLYDLTSRTLERLSSEGVSDRPEWTPDGKRLLYSSIQKDKKPQYYALWWQAADGSAPAELLYAAAENIREGMVAPDGRSLVYREDSRHTNRDVYLLPLVGERTPQPLLTSPYDELMPRISPDGKWLVYVSDESGQYEVYVRPFPGSGGRTLISAGGGMEPLWAPDGRRIFYRTGRQFVAASISASPAFAVTGHKILFEGNYQGHQYHPNYDVTHDGKSFIMLRPAGDERQLVVVLNWLADLRERTSGKR
ncbi:MAG TPA: hypothetical protein VHE78_00035, partial [Gemmatimonadaceae bacterium]|nr:hypothetical protein [Gemmatimonadaceae bacterium]